MWRFCLVPIEKVTPEMAELGHYTDIKYMRKSKDGLVLVKWQGHKPKCLYGIDEVTNINDELSKARWQDVEE